MTLEKILKSHIEIQEKATEGPWEYFPAYGCYDWKIQNSEFTFVKQDDPGVPVIKEDGEFISKSRTAWPATTKALQVAIKSMQWEIDNCLDGSVRRNLSQALKEIKDIMEENS